jgi:DNA-binding FadR family transcriptional regulator
LEFLEEVEATVATLAAKRATTDDIRILKRLVLMAQQHKDNEADDLEQFAQTDEEIQQEICRIADNPIYEFLLQSIHDNLDQYYERNMEPDAIKLNEKFQNLRMMVYAIGRNDESLYLLGNSGLCL